MVSLIPPLFLIFCALSPPKPAVPVAAAAKNFLGLGAVKAKAARNARRAASVGAFDSGKRAKRIRLSNSGSGATLDGVIRFKYQKGFTQAVRVPCRVDDLLAL